MMKPRQTNIVIDQSRAVPLALTRAPIRIGCAGWNCPRTEDGPFSAEGSHLWRYSQIFNCCEINSSFYRPHRNQTWERWADSVPADFRFAVKAPRTITHESRLKCAPSVLSAFLQQVRCLRDKLGPLLFQLPPSFEFENDSARNFLRLLRDNYSGDVVWEPRHSSWFEESASDLLNDFRIARVAADPARVPEAACPGGRKDLVYYRLHGSPRIYFSDYADDFLDDLAENLKNLAGRASVWCVFDNTGAGCAISNALALNAKSGQMVSGLSTSQSGRRSGLDAAGDSGHPLVRV